MGVSKDIMIISIDHGFSTWFLSESNKKEKSILWIQNALSLDLFGIIKILLSKVYFILLNNRTNNLQEPLEGFSNRISKPQHIFT